jgi:uncharacterized protein DUF6804
MATLDEIRESRSAAHPPPATPLDERAWQAWLTKGRLLEERSARVRLETVKLASIAGLLAGAGLWSYIEPYEIALRFGVAAAAIFVMFHALRSRRHIFAALFGALALLYNPVLPLFSASGDLQRLLLAIGATPFIASLGWRDVRIPR